MNHQETPSGRVYGTAKKTGSMPSNRQSLPYGMFDNPNTGALRSPCVDFYEFPKGLPCPTWIKRQDEFKKPPGERRWHGLPKKCQDCERRVAYAEALDPMLKHPRHKPTPARQEELSAEETPSKRGASSGAQARASSQARKLGYKNYKQALLTLYFDEDLTSFQVGKLLRISHSKALHDIKRFGRIPRRTTGGRLSRKKL